MSEAVINSAIQMFEFISNMEKHSTEHRNYILNCFFFLFMSENFGIFASK